MMNLTMYDDVFTLFKEYIKEHSTVTVGVYKKPSTQDYPKIIFQEISNLPLTNIRKRIESHSIIGFEINIYANLAQTEGGKDGMEIARYLEGICSEFMEDVLHLQRIVARPAPNIDESVYRILMQYNGKTSDYRGRFI